MLLAALRPQTAALVSRRHASTISGKYAQALFSAALARSPPAVAKVHADLSAVSKSLETNPDLRTFIHNPTLSVQERQKGIDILLSKLEGVGAKKERASDITANLFALLSENGRLGETEEVVQGFNELVAQHNGELNVTVTSAVPLAKDVLSRLEVTLKQSQAAKTAKTLKLTNKVNPSVVGGLVVDFGDKTIDLSVQARVTKLNNILTQSV